MRCLRRSRLSSLLLFLCLSWTAACGGGGGDSGGEPGSDDTLYVRASVGNDGNDGRSATSALRTIQAAVDRLGSGRRIVVGPGLYRSDADVVVNLEGLRGSAEQPIEIFADSVGTETGDAPAAVVVDAATHPFAIRLTDAQFVVVDGFTLTGSSGSDAAGLQVRRDSRNVTVRHCEVTSNAFDGIRVETSSNVVLFDNLVHANQQRGIQLGGGTTAAQLLHNTVALNGNDGISGNGSGSRDIRLRNNLVYLNDERGIDMREDATIAYDADYNLVYQRSLGTAYGPNTPAGLHDINLDPLLVSGFRLSQIASGQRADSPGVDAGDSGIDADLQLALRVRTTKTNRDPDTGGLDIGYHYPGRAAAPPTSTVSPLTASRTPATPTPTPPTALYVRASTGNDANNGRSPASALKTIQAAVDRVGQGGEIVVGPGIYPNAISFRAPGGTSRNPIRVGADARGERTGDAPGDVVIDASSLGNTSPVIFDAAPYIVLDGFQITGARAPAVQVRAQSTGVEIRHCEIFANQEDGVRVQDSDEVVLFDNLIYCNQRRGILVGGTAQGSNGTQLLNNTVVQNADRGLFVGTSDKASPNSFLRNNIVQDNGGVEIQVVTQQASSLQGYDADFNLVYDSQSGGGQYLGPTPGANDLNAAAGFVEVATCTPFAMHANDYRLAQTAAGQSTQGRGVDAGDPDTPSRYSASLRERTTATNDELDTPPIDLGFHFAP